MAIVVPTKTNMVETSKTEVSSKSDKKEGKNKDLQKTRMCIYFLEGKCGFGSSCTFAHSSNEVKSVPDLTKTQLCTKFAEGKCTDKNCTYAHGEAELRDPPNFKKKICKWHMKGKCRNGTSCGFAHDMKEIRAGAPPGFEDEVPQPLKSKTTQKIAGPPGLSLDDVCDASTDVPSSRSQAETDQSLAGVPSNPDEQLFRMAAGRGSAPLQQQVAMMTAAIGGLQAKLKHLEDMMMQSQVNQMQQTIQQLTEQCWALESGMCPEPKPQPTSQPTPLQFLGKSRLNAKAAPFKPIGASDQSDDSTSVGSE